MFPDIRFRGSYERAVRAPNVQELFLPQAPGLIAGIDPCAGTLSTDSNNRPTAAQCFNTFKNAAPNLTLAQYTDTYYTPDIGNPNPIVPQCVSAQCNTVTGGNPDLVPEVSDTKSFGVVFTPTFFKGFSLTVDYFDIKVDHAILDLGLPFKSIINGCLGGDAVACGLINRNPNFDYALFGGNGAANYGLVTTAVNAAQLATRGVDVNTSYRFAFRDFNMPDYGSLSLDFTGTYVSKLSTTLPGEEPYNCAGLYGTTCGTPTPKWHHQFRVNWITPWNVTLSVNWRYLSPTNLDCNTANATLTNCNVTPTDTNPSDAHIPAFSYFDMSFTWKVKDRYTFRGGVNNIFDRTPPLLDTNNYGIAAPAFGNGNTFPQVFDPLGRVLFMGVTADF